MGELRSTPCDLNGVNFEPDTYLGKLLKERTLTELMDKETEMVRDIKALDSDMQTLVYENYNKFISATDTIRKVSHVVGVWGAFNLKYFNFHSAQVYNRHKCPKPSSRYCNFSSFVLLFQQFLF